MNKPGSKSITSSKKTSVSLKTEFQRKSLHLPGLLIPFLYHQWPQITLLCLFCLGGTYMVSEWIRRRHYRSLPFFGNLVPQLSRSASFDIAPLYFILGLGITSVIFPLRSAFSGTLLVCLCDSIAALVGMKWGKRKILNLKKSYAGSLAFFFSASVALLPLLGWKGSLVTAALSTLAELFSQRGIDNLVLPLLGGLIAHQFLN